MPGAGLEPASPFGQWLLRPSRLPYFAIRARPKNNSPSSPAGAAVATAPVPGHSALDDSAAGAPPLPRAALALRRSRGRRSRHARRRRGRNSLQLAENVRRRRRIARLVMALLCGAVTLGPVPAGAQVSDQLPTPREPDTAAKAGADAGPQQSNQAIAPGEASPVAAAEPLAQGGFVTYRVFATQYQPNTPGAVEVALPDRCVKFASLGNTTALANANCGPGYPLGLDYRVTVARDNGAGVRHLPGEGGRPLEPRRQLLERHLGHPAPPPALHQPAHGHARGPGRLHQRLQHRHQLQGPGPEPLQPAPHGGRRPVRPVRPQPGRASTCP